MKVPKFKEYFATNFIMSPEQKRFYENWLEAWKKGKKISVNGQISYIFCYVYDILDYLFEYESPKGLGIFIGVYCNGKLSPTGLKKDYKKYIPKVILELKRIITNYPEEEKMTYYLKNLISDCYVLLQDYKNALKYFPELKPESKSAIQTDRLLALKLVMDKHLSGRDILTLNGPKVTAFGRRNLSQVSEYLDVQIASKEKEEGDILRNWKRTSPLANYFVFVGYFSLPATDFTYYQFSQNPKIIFETKNMIREAENTVREERGIPKIGEGWVQETDLYYNLKKSFPKLEIIHHARPRWLGKQHLDIFIPKLRVAIEYQGAQHFRPIDYFGGQKAYLSNKRRDATKKRNCSLNKIRLIEVKEGYNFSKLFGEIKRIKNDN